MFYLRNALFLGFVAVLFHIMPALAGDVQDVSRADPQRKAILDTIRPAVEARMRGEVEFVVSTLRVQNDWGFLIADPRRPSGQPIDPATTIYANDIDMMDGLSTIALVRHANGRWNLIELDIGSTDAAFVAWHEMYDVPKALLGM